MRYNIIKPIGDPGGFGQVYQCIDENSQIYALKRLINIDTFSVSRFEREVRLMSRLNHPNVIKMVAYNITADYPFYIMPLYQCSLTSVIPTLFGDYRRQLNIINSILSGIGYLHSEGVIHRDLKPGNILYNSDSDIAITDFGFGIQVSSDSEQLTKSTVFGTDRYCSPEQKLDSHNVDGRTDIYAIGMIIEDIVSNYNASDHYDSGIKYIIEKCTKRNREDRFESIAELSKYVTSVYNILLGISESENIEQSLLLLASNTIGNDEVTALALQLQSIDDTELIEKFFSGISPNTYTIFESNNTDLAKDLAKRVCSYWDEGRWPFSYIDSIANIIKKIYLASKNVDIKAILLHCLMDLAINYNRWYAMGIAEKLLDDAKHDIAAQTAIALTLKSDWLDLDRIVSNTRKLPPIILNAYNEGKFDSFY